MALSFHSIYYTILIFLASPTKKPYPRYTVGMKPLVIAVVMAVIMGIGIYIGTTGLVTQYSFIPGRSSAGSAACSPSESSVQPAAPALFAASGVPANALYHWAADEGSATVLADGKFSVQFLTPGTKSVSLFYFDRNVWNRVTCQVQVL
jgi:hypothetical protein